MCDHGACNLVYNNILIECYLISGLCVIRVTPELHRDIKDKLFAECAVINVDQIEPSLAPSFIGKHILCKRELKRSRSVGLYLADAALA